MKSFPSDSVLILLAVGVLSFAGCQKPEQPQKTYFLVVNPTSADHQTAIRYGLEEIVQRAIPLEKIVILQAPELNRVAVIEVPAVDPANRMLHHQVAKELVKLRPLLKETCVSDSGQLNLPELPACIRRHQPEDGTSLHVILCGSPVYDDPKYQGDSWRPGTAARDGYFFDPASPLCKGVSEFPADCKLSLLTPPEGFGVDTAHRQAIELSWRKYAKRFDSELIRFSDDPSVVLSSTSQYTDEVALDPDAPCELYVAATQTSGPIHVQIGRRRTKVDQAVAGTRNQILQQMAKQTSGLAILVDHSASTTCQRDSSGEYVSSPKKLAQFMDLRNKLGGLLERAETEYLNVIAFGVDSGVGGVDSVWSKMQPATPENRDEAVGRLKSFQCGRGTPIKRALQHALADGLCTRIVLVTDGLPSGGQTAVLDWLAKVRKVRDFELYTIGIGNQAYGSNFGEMTDFPVREFLTTVAIENGGAYVEWNAGAATNP